MDEYSIEIVKKFIAGNGNIAKQYKCIITNSIIISGEVNNIYKLLHNTTIYESKIGYYVMNEIDTIVFLNNPCISFTVLIHDLILPIAKLEVKDELWDRLHSEGITVFKVTSVAFRMELNKTIKNMIKERDEDTTQTIKPIKSVYTKERK